MTDNIISFPDSPHSTRSPSTVIRAPKSCAHAHTQADCVNRTLVCTDCGSVLDAFDWIASVFGGTNRYFERRDSLAKEVGQLKDSVAQLSREEANVKARLKRAKEQLKATQFTQHDVDMAKAQIKRFCSEAAPSSFEKG